MSTARPITKWSILALLAMVSGAAITLGVDQVFLKSWASSGRSFPIGEKATIDLPPGESLVWYESTFSVPGGDVTLYLFDADGERIKPTKPEGDLSYGLLLGGQSGRALWQLNLPRAGRYEFTAFNHNFESDRLVPAEDRVVFLKTPNSLTEVTFMRKLIQITGATASITLVILLYILHGLELRKRRTAAAKAGVSAVV